MADSTLTKRGGPAQALDSLFKAQFDPRLRVLCFHVGRLLVDFGREKMLQSFTDRASGLASPNSYRAILDAVVNKQDELLRIFQIAVRETGAILETDQDVRLKRGEDG